jgi:ABC-type transport system involved in Fe-S cluster assembly fused permease/ATPase subunit
VAQSLYRAVTLVPTKSSLKNKTALISELTAALERAKKDHVEAVVELAEVQAGVESEGEVDEEDGWDEAPDNKEMED